MLFVSHNILHVKIFELLMTETVVIVIFNMFTCHINNFRGRGFDVHSQKNLTYNEGSLWKNMAVSGLGKYHMGWIWSDRGQKGESLSCHEIMISEYHQPTYDKKKTALMTEVI